MTGANLEGAKLHDAKGLESLKGLALARPKRLFASTALSREQVLLTFGVDLP